ncbi:MAG TPA: hypothetical protein VFE62_19980 [Gemmataceae bacterium]|nr:hypothetical protein [Gemmataceae bacterium]
MVDEKDQDNTDPADPLLRMSPRHMELLRQQMTMTTGVKLELRLIRANLKTLRQLQNTSPEMFEAVLSIVKPAGLSQQLPAVSPQMIDTLKKALLMRPDGQLCVGLADVVHASYKETSEGPVLVDPVIYPSREVVDELEQLSDDSLARFVDRLVNDKQNKDKKHNSDGSPPLG